MRIVPTLLTVGVSTFFLAGAISLPVAACGVALAEGFRQLVRF
jgi:hypothetical protein